MTRLRKLSQSMNLGNMIDSNKALDLIRSTYAGQFSTDELRTDVGDNNSAIFGAISDDGTVAAELYCFKQSPGEFIGVAVGVRIDVTDAANKQYTIGTDYQCALANNKNNPLGITGVRDSMINGINIFGANVTFKNGIKNIDQLLQMLQQDQTGMAVASRK